MTSPVYHALIRTHHITSRKKVSTLKAAAERSEVFALLRSGGIPGLMYVEGSHDGVDAWVGTVHVSYQRCDLCCKIVEGNFDMRRAKSVPWT